MKNKKLKTESVFLTLFLLRWKYTQAASDDKKMNWRLAYEFGQAIDRSECEGRQNARPRVRFDKIFASFSSFGKGRASPAGGQNWLNSSLWFCFPHKKLNWSDICHTHLEIATMSLFRKIKKTLLANLQAGIPEGDFEEFIEFQRIPL